MYEQQRINIKFCFKIGKNATEMLELFKIAYGDNCLSKTQVFEWHRRFKAGREDVNDDERADQPSGVITEENIEKERDFVKVSKKSSVRFLEMKLGIPKTTIHRILTEKLGLQKLNSKFIIDFFTKNQIFLLQHSPYSPDLAPCDYFLFPKLHLAMKGNRFASIEDIQRSTTDILDNIPIIDIKKSFDALVERANVLQLREIISNK